MNEARTFAVNFVYVAFQLSLAVIFGGVGPVLLTMQVWTQFGTPAPWTGGWSPTLLAAVYLASTGFIGYLAAGIYNRAHVSFTEQELIQAGLFHSARISWVDVVSVKAIGRGLHVASDSTTIVVGPGIFKDPAAVVQLINEKTSGTVSSPRA